MARTAVRVRRAGVADLPALLDLHEELRAEVPTRRDRTVAEGLRQQQRAAVEASYVAALADPDQLVVLACQDDDVIGMALLSITPGSLAVPASTVLMSHVVVTGRARQRGAGRALVAAAASWAEERGADGVAVGVLPGEREVNRFYARLGFAPVSLRRVAPLATLRRRLETESVTAPRTDPFGLPLGRPHVVSEAASEQPVREVVRDREARRRGLLARTAAARPVWRRPV